MGVASSIAASTAFNYTLAISGQLSGQQHRNITFNLNWDYEKLDPLNRSDWDPGNRLDCQNAESEPGRGLAGVLGLKQIVQMGLMANSIQNDLAVLPSSAFVKNLSFPGMNPGGAALGNTLTGVFGSQVDFTLVEGIGGGPSWSQLHFRTGSGGSGGGASTGDRGAGTSSSGTGGSSGPGPLNFNRMAKDSLVISFAPACLRNDEHTVYEGGRETFKQRRLLEMCRLGHAH
jgi:hypothetical protein